MKEMIKAGVYVSTCICVLLLIACSDEPATPSAAHMSMPPPAVSVAKVVLQDISDWETFTGRLEAVENVELRPRVSGYIEAVVFEEGSLVKKGQLLFKIDDRPFRAEVSRLRAELKSAQAQIDLAQRDLKRASSLKQTNAISQEQLDNKETQLTKARADADSVRAALGNAKLNLSYTQVTAPIAGKISRANITEGNYVSQGVSVLTSLVSTDHMHAYFDVDEQSYANLVARSKLEAQTINDDPVLMSLMDDKNYSHHGKVDFVDNQINTTSGTIRMRATFENNAGLFTPGMFVRLKMRVSDLYSSILIDEKAIGTDLNHKFVFLLGADNIVEYRAVELGRRIGNLRSIRSGLSAEDVIIVKGLQRIGPGAQVEPTAIDMASESDLAKMDLHPSNG